MNNDKDKIEELEELFEEDEESDKKSLALRIFLLVACVLLLSIAFLFKPVLVDGQSMENTLFENDYAYSKRYIFEKPMRNDIVVVKTDKNLKLNRKTIVKRIIGMPGDVVKIKDNELYVNDKLVVETYAVGKMKENITIKLEKDQYYILGDNRNVSLDSRWFGPVKRSDLISKVFIILLPMERYGEVK